MIAHPNRKVNHLPEKIAIGRYAEDGILGEIVLMRRVRVQRS